MDRENEKNNHFTAELEINDYPSATRTKVSARDFLNSIYDLTGCQVSVRGLHFEAGKRPQFGQKKLYLYIEGSSKPEVANAHKELKRVIEESAVNSMTLTSGYSGGTGRYSVI